MEWMNKQIFIAHTAKPGQAYTLWGYAWPGLPWGKEINYVCPGHCLSQTHIHLTSMCDHLLLATTSHQLPWPLFWPDGFIIYNCFLPPQGAKKFIFTACHLGKLMLAFTSPDIISTSPKSFLTGRNDFTVLLLFEFLKKHHLPIGPSWKFFVHVTGQNETILTSYTICPWHRK